MTTRGHSSVRARSDGHADSEDASTELVPVEGPDEPVGEEDDEGTVSAFGELRFLFEGLGTCWDVILYARESAESIHPKGPWRTANIVYAYAIAFPGLALCYLTAWAFFMRLRRAIKSTILLVALALPGNRIPILEALVWDGLDVSTWFSWVSAPAPSPPATPPTEGVQ